MHHLLEHIKSRYKKEMKKDKDSTVNKTEYKSNRIKQVNPGESDKQPKYQAATISSIDKSLSRNSCGRSCILF